MESFLIGHRKRMFEKLYSHSELTQVELLEILLFFVIKRRDTKIIAKALLQKFKTINSVCEASPKLLMEIDGIGQSAANIIKCFSAITNRLLFNKISDVNIIDNFNDLIKYAQCQLSHKIKEEFHVIYLNIKYHIIHCEKYTNGEPGHIEISPRNILHQALNYGTTSIILIHNHPSGDPTPSPADIETTNNIKNILSTVSIKIFDHLIIAGENFFSFKKMRLI